MLPESCRILYPAAGWAFRLVTNKNSPAFYCQVIAAVIREPDSVVVVIVSVRSATARSRCNATNSIPG